MGALDQAFIRRLEIPSREGPLVEAEPAGTTPNKNHLKQRTDTMSSVYQPSPNHIAGSGKREARPYPQSLPASGAEACRWLLETMFAGMAGKAWVTLVHDVEAGSQWQGGRLKETKLDFNDESGAYYVAVGIVRAGAAQRLAADIEAVAALVLDDVGDTT